MHFSIVGICVVVLCVVHIVGAVIICGELTWLASRFPKVFVFVVPVLFFLSTAVAVEFLLYCCCCRRRSYTNVPVHRRCDASGRRHRIRTTDGHAAPDRCRSTWTCSIFRHRRHGLIFPCHLQTNKFQNAAVSAGSSGVGWERENLVQRRPTGKTRRRKRTIQIDGNTVQRNIAFLVY